MSKLKIIIINFIVLCTTIIFVHAQSDTTIIACDSARWHGTGYYESGDYGFPATMGSSTTTVDSLHLIIYYGTHNVVEVDTCDTYTWREETYNASGVYYYEYTNEKNCPSADTLHLTIRKPTAFTDVHAACDSFTWIDGITYTSSTDTPTVTLTNAAGCDSIVTLHLTINNPVHSSTTIDTCESYTWTEGNGQTYTESGNYTWTTTGINGCDSVVTLHLIILKPTHTSITVTECDSFTWPANGKTYIQSNNYNYIHLDSNGCTQVDTLHLTINKPEHLSITDTACESYTWHNATYLESGTYTYSHQDDHGCWQVDTLHLTINNPVTVHFDTAICSSSLPLTWHDTIFKEGTVSGDYILLRKTVQNCDSVVMIALTVYPAYDVTDTKTICASQLPYQWNGATFTTAGTQTTTLHTVNGCDSMVTMTLTVNPTYNVTDTKTICASQLPYEWNGVTFATAGTKTTTLNTVNGCDSMVTMILTVNPTYNVTDTKTICASLLPYEWNGVTFAAAGTKNVTLQSVNYCDSIVAMTLTVNPTYNTPITESICQGQSYNFYGQNLTTAGVYTHTLTTSKGCDSIITLTLTVTPLPTVTISGEGSFCQGDNVTLTAMGAISYAWDNGSQTATTMVSTGGTYTVTGTDANGCVNTARKTVAVNQTYNITVHDTICQGESYNFFGQSLTDAGSYTHTLYTSKGCDSVITLTLTVNPLPVVTISGNTSICQGQTTILTASDAAAYLWSNGDTTKTSIVNAAGTYRLTCTNQYGCTASADTVVTVDTLPVITIIGENQFCHGSNTVLKASGAGNYVWSTEEPSDSITVSSGGIYSVTGTDSHGCSASAALSVTENPLPNITIAGNSAFCQGDSITLTASGADSYSWSTGSVLSSTTIDEGGAYTVIGTNAYSCTATTSKTVSMNPLPTVSISGASSFCEGYSTSLTASTPTSCTYAWSQGANTATITVNNPAIYTVTATNANGCANTATQEVTETPTVAELVEATACEEYDWNGSVYNISGDYTKTLTAINGCDSIATLHLTINYGTHNVLSEIACESYTWHGTAYYTSGTYTFAYNNNFGCPSVDTLHLTVNYGTHNVETETDCESYTWHGITYYTSGIYTYAYTNTLGCESMDTLHLTVHHPIHNADSVTECDHYTWTKGTGQTYTTSGIYTYAHQDAHGCTQVDTLHLVINPSPTPFIFGDSSVCYGEVATLTAAGGETYQWITEDVGNSIVVAMEGLYTVTATNMYGCSSTAEFTVSIAASPLAKKDIVGKSHADGSYYMLIYPEADLQYQWYKNSVLIVGATKQYYYPSDYTLEGSLELNACYQVEVRPNDQNLCGIMTDCWEKPESMTEKIRILPNPNNGRFKLLLPEGTVDVQILNANGQLVLSRKTDGAIELEMDTGLANGLYFVKTFRQDGSFNTEKLIINR